MGREIKRVNINWDWFERHGAKTWKGYLLDEIECPLCEGSGRNFKNTDYCNGCYGEKTVCPKVEPDKGWEHDNSEGYQVWQDVSEGGPVSPVFLKPEDLAKWMVENDDSVTRGTSYEAWLKMIKEEGCTPSFVGGLGGGFNAGTSLYEDKESSD